MTHEKISKQARTVADWCERPKQISTVGNHLLAFNLAKMGTCVSRWHMNGCVQAHGKSLDTTSLLDLNSVTCQSSQRPSPVAGDVRGATGDWCYKESAQVVRTCGPSAAFLSSLGRPGSLLPQPSSHTSAQMTFSSLYYAHNCVSTGPHIITTTLLTIRNASTRHDFAPGTRHDGGRVAAEQHTIR
jgi:hypothetical protein